MTWGELWLATVWGGGRRSVLVGALVLLFLVVVVVVVVVSIGSRQGGTLSGHSRPATNAMIGC